MQIENLLFLGPPSLPILANLETGVKSFTQAGLQQVQQGFEKAKDTIGSAHGSFRGEPRLADGANIWLVAMGQVRDPKMHAFRNSLYPLFSLHNEPFVAVEPFEIHISM